MQLHAERTVKTPEDGSVGQLVIVRSSASHLLVLDGATLGNVDTVQELTDILVLDEARLVDGGRGAGSQVDVGSLNDDLILGHLGLANAGVITEHIDGANDLLTQEVTDLDTLAAVNDGNVNGEMGIDQTHAVTITLGGTGDHVVDVGADGTEARNLLGETIVQGNLDLLAIVDLVDGDRQVTEVTLEGVTVGTLNGDTTRVNLDRDPLGDVDSLLGADDLHCN